MDNPQEKKLLLNRDYDLITMPDGSRVPRFKVGFRLIQNKGNPNFFHGVDGTIYFKTETGTLRRVTKKKKARARLPLKRPQPQEGGV